MIAKRTFGKLGKRSGARLDIAIDGGMSTIGQSQGCRVANVSRDGCCLHMGNTPRLGSDIMVKIERVETLGRVAWVRNGRCGVKFTDPLNQKQLRRLRWIVDHPEGHRRNMAKSASVSWR